MLRRLDGLDMLQQRAARLAAREHHRINLRSSRIANKFTPLLSTGPPQKFAADRLGIRSCSYVFDCFRLQWGHWDPSTHAKQTQFD